MVNFVTRSGTQLMLNGSPFRFAGCNAYQLGLLENPIRYPTQFEIDDWLATAKEMGAKVIRSITLGVSVGNSLSIWPTLNTTNSAAFTMIDYAIYKAGLLGLYLIIPLTDNYHLYFGGKHTFTDWRSITDETQFYSNSTVIADFEAYISAYLNHVNQYTNLAYKNDPTVLAWQTGNELVNPFPGSTWSTTISAYIKSIDSNHLVMDGACASTGMDTTFANLHVSTLDIYDDHYYPTLASTLASDASAVSAAGKAFAVGEFDWTLNVTGPNNGSATIDTTTAAPGGGSQSVKTVVTQVVNNAFNVNLQQASLSITAGDVYSISFWAKAQNSYIMNARVQSAHGSFAIYAQQGFTLTSSWTQYSFNFAANTTDANAQLQFTIGNAATTTWIDLASLIDTTAAPGVNMLSNPSFENSTLAPWTFNSLTIVSDDLAVFLPAVESNTSISGDLFWSLLPHNDTYGFLLHNEVYSLYYPGQTADQQNRAQLLRTHAYAMGGLPHVTVAGPVAAPLITSISAVNGNNVIAWRGVSGGATYDIERNSQPAPDAFAVVAARTTDAQAPATDPTLQAGWYRVRAYNASGVPGPYSTPVQSAPFSILHGRDGKLTLGGD